MRCIYNRSTDPAFNLAAEDWLLHNATDDIFMLWRNARAVIVGRNQNTLAEINEDFVRTEAIPVVRRLTGGGAVFHDLGNLNFTCISLHTASGALDFRRFIQPVADALQTLGVPCVFSGRNDLVANGKKISGNAQYVYKNRVLHHGTLLFSACLDNISQALKPNHAKYAGRAVSSVRSRVGNIVDFLPQPMSIEAFIDFLLQHMSGGGIPSSNVSLSEQEARAIESLAEKKYRSWEWNYGHVPQYAFTRVTRTEGGVLDIHLDVRQGRLERVRIFGDYFGVRDVAELEEHLCGCRHTREDLMARLEDIALESYLYGVSREAFCDCLF